MSKLHLHVLPFKNTIPCRVWHPAKIFSKTWTDLSGPLIYHLTVKWTSLLRTGLYFHTIVMKWTYTEECHAEMNKTFTHRSLFPYNSYEMDILRNVMLKWTRLLHTGLYFPAKLWVMKWTYWGMSCWNEQVFYTQVSISLQSYELWNGHILRNMLCWNEQDFYTPVCISVQWF